MNTPANTLTQTLAVQSQVHLPGTVGRMLKQIRDLERLAPRFVEARLVRPVARPNPLSLRVAGIRPDYDRNNVFGGFVYVSAAVRVDVTIENNALATSDQDSRCVIDDIDFEDQTKRLQLIGLRQCYELATAAMENGASYDLLLFDGPLVLNRSMVPIQRGKSAAHRDVYEAAVEAIRTFWGRFREQLFPWNPNGPVLAGLDTGQVGAIAAVSQQDLRVPEGRQQILAGEGVQLSALEQALGSEAAITSIGERRFIHGIVGSCCRTAAFRMNLQLPEMEPRDVVKEGVIGFHYRAGAQNNPLLVQLLGAEPGWDSAALDLLAGRLMALTVLTGRDAIPLPLQLAAREQLALPHFLALYTKSVGAEMKKKSIEDIWLADFDEPLTERKTQL